MISGVWGDVVPPDSAISAIPRPRPQTQVGFHPQAGAAVFLGFAQKQPGGALRFLLDEPQPFRFQPAFIATVFNSPTGS